MTPLQRIAAFLSRPRDWAWVAFTALVALFAIVGLITLCLAVYVLLYGGGPPP